MCTPPNLHKRRTCNVFSSGAKTKTKKLQQKQTKFPHCGWGEKGGGAHSRLQGLSRSLPARCVHVVLAQSRTQILVCSYWVATCFHNPKCPWTITDWEQVQMTEVDWILTVIIIST